MEIRLAKCFATVAAPTYFQDDCTCRAVFSIISSSRSMVVVAAHSEPVCRQSIYDDLWAGQNQRMKLVSDWSLHRFSRPSIWKYFYTQDDDDERVCVTWLVELASQHIHQLNQILSYFWDRVAKRHGNASPLFVDSILRVCVCVWWNSRASPDIRGRDFRCCCFSK